MRRLLPLSLSVCLVSIIPTAGAADAALTIYRSDSETLYEAGSAPVADGHAVVHEQRTLQLSGGAQTLVIDGLPALLDSEAVAVDFRGAARVLAQRVLAAGDSGLLGAHRGQRVHVFGADNTSLAEGTLVALDGGNLGVRSDDGRISYLRDFARVEFPLGTGLPGSTLQLSIDGKAGAALASLSYATAGLGWRAAYAALLATGSECRLRLDAFASIANRSGRDYPAAQLKLIAGAPNFAKYDRGPRPLAMKAMAAPTALPEQSAIGDYRSYAIDGALDLPDASVTQVPLYASHDLGCERRWLFENGGAWFAPKPLLTPEEGQNNAGPVQSQLTFAATENLPSGNLRVSTRDKDERRELLGENRIGDVAKGRTVDVNLGVAFDLAATRERTAFSVDKTAREMNEGFRIMLSNSGEVSRTVTVREHPNRWRNWVLLSSSEKPETQTPDTLQFHIVVPANATATLDYAVHYSWTPADE